MRNLLKFLCVLTVVAFASCSYESSSQFHGVDTPANIYLSTPAADGTFQMHLGVASTVQATTYCVSDDKGTCTGAIIPADTQSVVGSKKIFHMSQGIKPPLMLQIFNDNAPARRVAVEQDIAGPAPTLTAGEAPKNYLDLSEMKSKLIKWSGDNSQMLSYGSFGKANGQEINYLRINDKSTYGTKPKVLFYASVHGDEAIAAAMLVGLTHRLLNSFNSDANVQNLMRTRDIIIIPVACPDGYANDSREVEGVDPNRTFPWKNDKNAKATQCIQNLKDLYEREKFDAILDYHASGRMWLLPWGYSYNAKFEEPGKANLLKQLGKEMAELNGYRWGAIPNMVGYEAPGSSIDYYYDRSKELGIQTVALGAEVGTSKRPSPAGIEVEVEKNWEPMLHFLKNAPGLFATKPGSWGAYDPNREVIAPQYYDLSNYFVPGKE